MNSRPLLLLLSSHTLPFCLCWFFLLCMIETELCLPINQTKSRKKCISKLLWGLESLKGRLRLQGFCITVIRCHHSFYLEAFLFHLHYLFAFSPTLTDLFPRYLSHLRQDWYTAMYIDFIWRGYIPMLLIQPVDMLFTPKEREKWYNTEWVTMKKRRKRRAQVLPKNEWPSLS